MISIEKIKQTCTYLTDQQIAFSLQRIFLETFQSFSKTLLSECDYDPASGDLPLQVQKVYENNLSLVYYTSM